MNQCLTDSCVTIHSVRSNFICSHFFIFLSISYLFVYKLSAFSWTIICYWGDVILVIFDAVCPVTER